MPNDNEQTAAPTPNDKFQAALSELLDDARKDGETLCAKRAIRLINLEERFEHHGQTYYIRIKDELDCTEVYRSRQIWSTGTGDFGVRYNYAKRVEQGSRLIRGTKTWNEVLAAYLFCKNQTVLAKLNEISQGRR